MNELDDNFSEMATALRCIKELTKEEWSSVTILSPNHDFIGPRYAIEVGGLFESEGRFLWEEKRFTGDTLLEALEDAVNQCIQ